MFYGVVRKEKFDFIFNSNLNMMPRHIIFSFVVSYQQVSICFKPLINWEITHQEIPIQFGSAEPINCDSNK